MLDLPGSFKPVASAAQTLPPNIYLSALSSCRRNWWPKVSNFVDIPTDSLWPMSIMKASTGLEVTGALIVWPMEQFPMVKISFKSILEDILADQNTYMP